MEGIFWLCACKQTMLFVADRVRRQSDRDDHAIRSSEKEAGRKVDINGVQRSAFEVVKALTLMRQVTDVAGARANNPIPPILLDSMADPTHCPTDGKQGDGTVGR